MTLKWAKMVARYTREGHPISRMFSRDERLAAVAMLARAGDEAAADIIRRSL